MRYGCTGFIVCAYKGVYWLTDLLCEMFLSGTAGNWTGLSAPEVPRWIGVCLCVHV